LSLCTVYGKGANPPKSISAPEARLQAAGTGSPGGDSTRVWRRVSAPAPARPKRSHRPRRRPKGFLGGRQISCPEDPCEKSSPEPTRASGDKLSCCRHVRGPFSPLRAGSFAPGVSGPLILFIFQLPTPGPWAGNRGRCLSAPCTGRVQTPKTSTAAPEARLRAAKTSSPARGYHPLLSCADHASSGEACNRDTCNRTAHLDTRSPPQRPKCKVWCIPSIY
jgi:hypothetical protein